MKNGDQPAFPISEEETDRIDTGINIYTGLSKREYFAAMAMQGILSNTAIGTDPIGTARTAATYADALLKQLGEQP